MAQFSFATFLIVCPTSFFLGILFSLFPYDYPLLWSGGSTSDAHLSRMEAHLRLIHASPALIVRILHTMIFLGGAGLVAKLYKPSESNMLFDGGSLVLYVCGIVVYVANIVKGLRIVTLGVYRPLTSLDDDADAVDADAIEADTGSENGRNLVVGREDNIKVLSASNTILALVLLGVLVLQAGQWYAERADERDSRTRDVKKSRHRDNDAGNSDGDAAGDDFSIMDQTVGGKESHATATGASSSASAHRRSSQVEARRNR